MKKIAHFYLFVTFVNFSAL